MKFSIVTHIVSVFKFHAIKTFGFWKFILPTNLWKWIIAKMVGGFPRHKRSSITMHLTITIMNKFLRSIIHVCVPFIVIHECMMGLRCLSLSLEILSLGKFPSLVGDFTIMSSTYTSISLWIMSCNRVVAICW